jgi:PKD repeat protein
MFISFFQQYLNNKTQFEKQIKDSFGGFISLFSRKKTVRLLMIILWTVALGILLAGSTMAVTPEVVVSPNESSDYTSIQDSINNANDSDIIEVKSGVYEEPVEINKSVVIISEDGATIANTSTTASNYSSDEITAGIEILEGSSPSISGFTLTGWKTSIDANSTSGDWQINNSSVKNSTLNGVNAKEATGGWKINNTIIDNTSDKGVSAVQSNGNWTLQRVTISNSSEAINAAPSYGNWQVTNGIIENNSNHGIYAVGSEGSWEINYTVFTNNKEGVEYGKRSEKINLSYNYWGASDGPSGDFAGSGDSVVGNVTISPYYTDSALRSLSTDDDSTETTGSLVDVAPSDLEGSGTSSDPYIITNSSELQVINDALDASYALGTDIDATGTDRWNDGSGFTPIGSDSSTEGSTDGFTGEFDGNKNSISNLSINRSSTDRVGLFGVIEPSGTVGNFSLDNVSIEGNNNVGGVVGSNNGEISNVAVTGTVQGSGFQIGGLAGDNSKAVINQSYSHAEVKGSNKVGGLIGTNLNGNVTEAYATGFTAGFDQVGGLIGDDPGSVNSTYWDIETTNQSTSAGGTGLETANMTGEDAPSTMTGLSFESDWVTQDDDYPVFEWQIISGDEDSDSLRAIFEYTPVSPQIGDTVTFNASESTESDAKIVTYGWNTGDDSRTKTGQKITHTYESPGEYTVELIVTDTTGASNSTTQRINITSSIDKDIIETPTGDKIPRKYAKSDGTVTPSGIGDAAADFRAGKISPSTLGDIARGFRAS